VTFGLATLKAEGAPVHPDEIEADLTDEQYLRQLQRYKDCHGADSVNESIVRNYLLKDLT
jgi:hypothetical protein